MSLLNGLRNNPRQKARQQQHDGIDTPAPTGGNGEGAPCAPGDVEAVAGAIEKAGMSVPASLALEVGKPLSWLGGQMLWILQPFTDALGIRSRGGALSVEGVARMLEREGSVDALVERLDAGNEKSGGRR